LRQQVAALQATGQRQVRSTGGMRVSVDEPPGPCPVCGGAMCVQKTIQRHGITLEHGPFQACETVHVCAAGCRRDGGLATHRAAALVARLPPKGVVGYDVIVFVGLARFVAHRQREEIRASLEAQHGILLSTGEISALGRRFLAYLEALHEAHAAELRAALDQDGGWPLHVDATGEDGRGTLLVAFAGWRRWVLGAWKVPTERAEVILPRLRALVDRFGAPCAIMRDLGRAVKDACDDLVAALGRDIPVLACHLHFLRDVGGDLLRAAHDQLRALLRRFTVKPALRALARDLGRTLGTDIAQARTGLSDWQTGGGPGHVLPDGQAGLATVRALAQWVLDFHADGHDQGFPFDLPYLDLHDRCRTACRAADAFRRPPIADPRVHKALDRLRRILHPVDSQVPFAKVAATLRARAALFTELRDALRLRPKPAGRNAAAPPGLTPEQATAELQDIHLAFDALTASLAERRPERGPAQDQRQAIDILLAHLNRHGDTLFGHAIQLPDCIGGGIHLVDRTNNSLEGLFDDMKHGERRRSGRKILTQDFEQLPPGAALATNLRHDDYVAIVCGSLDQLPQAFAQLDAATRRRSSVVTRAAARVADATDCDVVSASLPTADRLLVRTDEMGRRIQAAARSRAPRR
jgi:hypothetical protein